MARAATSMPSPAERAKILKLLDDVAPTLDDLLLSGLASASDSTRSVLLQSFQSASQMRLLRLGSTLRVAAEEVGRYAGNDPLFSRRRYSFFVNRAWMLSQGMRHALDGNDAEHWKSLTWQPGGRKVESMRVVTLGVSKRVVPGAFCGFEFRLRRLDGDSPMSLIWSTVFPLKKDVDIPVEAYLRLPQKQKFKAYEFLEGHVLEIRDFQLSQEGRIQLTDASTVQQQAKFEDWNAFASWNPSEAAERLETHRLNPFELDIELQEEVVLRDWKVAGTAENGREHRLEIEVVADRTTFKTFASRDKDGKAFQKRLAEWSKRSLPLFGVMHYEQGALILQPLSVLESDGPRWLSLDDKKLDYRSLIKALNF